MQTFCVQSYRQKDYTRFSSTTEPCVHNNCAHLSLRESCHHSALGVSSVSASRRDQRSRPVLHPLVGCDSDYGSVHALFLVLRLLHQLTLLLHAVATYILVDSGGAASPGPHSCYCLLIDAPNVFCQPRWTGSNLVCPNLLPIRSSFDVLVPTLAQRVSVSELGSKCECNGKSQTLLECPMDSPTHSLALFHVLLQRLPALPFAFDMFTKPQLTITDYPFTDRNQVCLCSHCCV